MSYNPLVSLRGRLAALLLIVLAPLFAMVFLMHFKHRHQDIDRAGANGLQLARLASEHHDRLVEGVRQLLAGLARLPEVRDLDVARCNATFAEVLRDNPVYGSITLSNDDGDIISPAAPAAQQLNINDQLWFQPVRHARGFTVGGYQWGRVTNDMVLICGLPLLDEQGRTRAVISASLRTKWLERFAQAANLPPGSTFTVVGQDGKVWARYPDGAAWVGKSVPEAPVVRNVHGAGLTDAPDLAGAARICAYAPLSVSSVGSAAAPGSPVYVLVSMPRQAVLAPANRELAVGLAGLSLVTLVTLVAAAIGSRLWVLRWMDRLGVATRRLAAGNLAARAGLAGGPSEFRRLGDSFDEMAAAAEQAAARRDTAESDLRRSHELLRAVVGFVSEAMFIKDLQGRYLLVNAAGAELLGRSADEVIGKDDFELIPHATAEAVRRSDRDIISNGTPQTFEETLDIDGSAPRHFLTRKAPYRDINGQVVGLLGITRDTTAWKEAEQTIRRSEQHLRNVLDSIFTFVGVLTPDGVLTEVNRAALVAVGAEPGEVLGKPFEQTRWWSQSEPARVQLREAIARAARGERSRYDVTTRIVDGRPVVIDLMIAPMLDESGGVTHIVASAIDVSEQRHVEHALRESEERLSLAMRAAGLGTWDDDLRTGKSLWSEQNFRLLGYQPLPQSGEATYEMWRTRVHPDDLDRVMRAMHIAMRDRSLYSPEYRVVHMDGQIGWLSVAGRFVYDGNQPVRFIGVTQDSTARKRAEEEIARLMQQANAERIKLEAVLRQMPAGVVIAEAASGRIVLRNEQVSRIWRRAIADGANGVNGANGDNHFEWNGFHPDGRPYGAAEWPLARCIASGERVAGQEIEILRSDGTRGYISVNAGPILDGNGNIVAGVATFYDITERKTAQTFAKTQQAELIHLSRLSTMGQMAAGLAHELNQPLGAILNYAGVCLDRVAAQDVVDAKVVKALEEVAGETRRAGEIIRRLRGFARKEKPNVRPTPLNPLVREAVAMVASELRYAGVHLEFELLESLPDVMVDGVQIEQVLVNLVRNAIDSMAETDAPARRLTLRTETMSGALARVSVIDAGCGIPADVRSRIFDAFFTTKPDGLGMGLPICQSIIQGHGGNLTIANNDGCRGAAVCFTLPLALGETLE
jgi:PAS domain S-box-containing protein